MNGLFDPDDYRNLQTPNGELICPACGFIIEDEDECEEYDDDRGVELIHNPCGLDEEE